MSFSSQLNQTHLLNQAVHSLQVTEQDVKHTLHKDRLSLNDLPVLISPAASNFLEEMAQRAHDITIQRFGHTMQLFIPMYLSNECNNTCTYCGFSQEYDYKRKTLTKEEIENEANVLRNKGFDHVLLLTGEAPKSVDVTYIANAISTIAPLFSSIGIEIQPLDHKGYLKLRDAGADSLTLYQETYHREAYKKYHLFGKKRLFNHRLDAVEEGAKTGFYRINIGVLLGLYDFRFEALALAEHLDYLQKRYWTTKYGISFPRIKDMVGDFSIDYPVNDKDFVQLICAFRLVFPDLAISLSTRETPEFRNNVIPLGITSVSAESDTSPGGYSDQNEEKQFEISDHRSLKEIKKQLLSIGYEPVMKDWDKAYERHH